MHDGDDPTKVYQIDVNKRLGKGGFGEVFQATDLRSGEVRFDFDFFFFCVCK